jgi:hypothetical protein
MHCSTRQFLFISLLVGFVLMHETRTEPFNKAEGAFASWLEAYSPRPAAAPLAVIQISDDDLKNSKWPWQPVDYSLFLNATLPFQPSVLAIEPVLAWEKADGVDTLHNQALRVPKLLLSAELGTLEDPALIPPMQEVPVLRHVEGSIFSIDEYQLVSAQPGDDLKHSAALGFFGPAANRPVSRVPLLYRYRGELVPSFVLQAAMLWYGVTPEEVRVVIGSYIELGKSARVPIDADGTMAVNFTIPTAAFSYPDLLLSAEQLQTGHETTIPARQLKDSLVLLARADQEARKLPLANGKWSSRGELAAAAIATIQQQRYAGAVPIAVSVAVLAFFLGVGWAMSRVGKFAASVICIGAFALYVLIALGIFTSWQVALPFGLPVGMSAFLLLFRQFE